LTPFFRFPHTPHLAWLGPGKPRDDKVLSSDDAQDLLADEVVVEEKVDGANLGFSVDESGALRAQNRGRYLDVEAARDQWKPLKRWLQPHHDRLGDALFPDLMLFGEWCYAVHSIRYSRLPDWFLVFDVYDRKTGEFWTVERRNALADRLGMAVVPLRAQARVDLLQLQTMMNRSELTDGPAEGLYVRRESEGRLVARSKLVRSEFTQSIQEHWSSRPLELNQLASSGSA
jgi:ATP-dependent RNA circularization protein (DNA/RNA ligase family)